MDLFQYWDTGAPPADIADWICGFRDTNPTLSHRLYDRLSAAHFIRKRLGEREWRAFEACAVPAMQADYFRLCALWAKGGIYIDADMRPRQPLSGLLERWPGPLILEFNGFYNSPFMVFSGRRNPFLGAVLKLATDNIETHRFDNVLMTTGPALADAVRALLDPEWLRAATANADRFAVTMRFGRLLDRARELVPVTPSLVSAYQAITPLSYGAIWDWMDQVSHSYEDSDRDWRRWIGPIYQKP